jgi:CDP-paratose 2-epimerase
VEQLRFVPFWSTARAATTSTKTLSDAPRVLNGSGGLKHSASRRQLSAWYAEPFGPHPIAAEVKDRPFDVPWLVLDSSRTAQVRHWETQAPLESIRTKIAEHAEQHPDWLDATAD